MNPEMPNPAAPSAPPQKPTVVNTNKHSARVLLIVVGIVVLVGLLAVALHKSNNPTSKAASAPVASVTISAAGFTPQTLKVKAGTKVQWKDTDSTAHLLASNPYPKDDSLASLKSRRLGQGSSYSYTFNTQGTYNYHDDLNPSLNGVVVVQ